MKDSVLWHERLLNLYCICINVRCCYKVDTARNPGQTHDEQSNKKGSPWTLVTAPGVARVNRLVTRTIITPKDECNSIS